MATVDDFFVPPTKEQLQLIRREINEDEDRMAHVEVLLHQWINCQPHFPKNYDKRVVRTFLRNSKHNMDRAKNKIECLFAARSICPDLFSERVKEDITRGMNTISMIFLPSLTKSGNRIGVYSLEGVDPSNFNPYAVSKFILMTLDIIFTWQHPVAGDVAIFDADGVTVSHYVKIVTLIKIITGILRQTYTIRLKTIHIINAPPAVDQILRGVKPFLNHKLKNSIINHCSIKSLSDYFDVDILPSNYGGNNKTVSELRQEWRKILESNEDWLIEQGNVKMTEPVRKKLENLHFGEVGVQGSFRTLQID